MNPNFRIATAGDLELLLELMREFYSMEHLEFDESSAVRSLHELIEHAEHGKAVLIEDERVPLGYFVLTYGFSLEFGGRFALLDELYVRPSFQGNGIGTAAMSFVEELCRRAGMKAVRLEVHRTNEIAQRLYRKVGYVDQQRDLLTKWLMQPEGAFPQSKDAPDLV
jgi:ribosomal protein S18 acetylase RimI-like enzyme